MVLAGRSFQSHDIEVSYICLRYDLQTIDPERDDLTVLPMPVGLNIRTTERRATGLIMERWLKDKPDVVLIAGWPFFELAGRAQSVGVRSVFIDAGAVPHDDLEGHALCGLQLEFATSASDVSALHRVRIADKRFHPRQPDSSRSRLAPTG